MSGVCRTAVTFFDYLEAHEQAQGKNNRPSIGVSWYWRSSMVQKAAEASVREAFVYHFSISHHLVALRILSSFRSHCSASKCSRNAV